MHRPNRGPKQFTGSFAADVLPVLVFLLFVVPSVPAQADPDSRAVTLIHAWGITNPAPALYGTSIPIPAKTHCTVDPPLSCWELTNDTSTPDRCWTNTAQYGPYPDCSESGDPCHDSSGNQAGKWHAWIRNWWLQGWLPSIGSSPGVIRKAYVIYNRNQTLWGGPGHYQDCQSIAQLLAAFVDAYTTCDLNVVVTTHSNGGVTFLWAWRDFIETALNGPMGATYDSQRSDACIAKERTIDGNGGIPPLFVNGHLMQAAVGDGNTGLWFESDRDFFPIQPYDTVGKTYWEPANALGYKRALLGVRFYYNREDVMTYDFTGVSTVGRNKVLTWLDGTLDGFYVGASFWLSRPGSPPYVALHACGHTSAHSASMGADNSICGDLLIRDLQGPGGLPWYNCSTACSENLSKWYESTQGPATCLNPCHRNCWGPTALTAIRIRDPATFPDKFPFSYGNTNLLAMGQSLGLRGWFDNAWRLDWTQLYDRQMDWCSQDGLDKPQERPPDENGRWPKYGQLIPGRDDSTGEVQFP